MICGKRGQAAVEFLSTYGWALLAVAVVFSALFFFDVLNMDNRVPESCDLGDGMSCLSVAVNQADEDMYFVDLNIINSDDELLSLSSNAFA